MSAYRILIVDEDPPYRLEARQVLERDPSLRVTAEASNGHEALWKAESQRPDLVLLSRRLPGRSGIPIAVAIRRHLRRTRVLLVVPVVDYD